MGRLDDVTCRKSGPVAPDAALAALAARQHGVVTLAQLLAIGLGARGVQHRAAKGQLHRLHRGVYAVGHRALMPDGHRLAAVLACGPGAVLSHRSAAAAWGLRQSSQTRWDVTTDSRGRRGPSAVALRRVHRLHVDDVTILRSVPITSVARTLVDLAAVLPAQVVERAMHEAEVLRLFDARKLQEALARAPTARGTRRLRAMLAESSPGMTRSALEERFLALCRATRLPLPRLNLHIPTRQGLLEVDAYWPSVRLIVELDGEASHLTSRAFHTDRRRDTALAAEGYLVMRFTSQRVARDPEGIRTELARVFALRSSSGPD